MAQNNDYYFRLFKFWGIIGFIILLISICWSVNKENIDEQRGTISNSTTATNCDSTKVRYIKSGTHIYIDNNLLPDSTDVGVQDLCYNDTGKELVIYSVSYTQDGFGSSACLAAYIPPKKFFRWSRSDENREFTRPPEYTSVKYYDKDKKPELQILFFLDYIDKALEFVEIPDYIRTK